MAHQDVTGDFPNDPTPAPAPGGRARERAPPWKRAGLKRQPKTARMDHLWGILNPYGDVWSYRVFDTPEEARAHLEDFWRDYDKGEPTRCYRIVPVKVQRSVDLARLYPTTEAGE
jgi:hypothetical protein